jgi:hypothetical protein
MHMRDEDAGQTPLPQTRSAELELRPLTTIEEQQLPLAHDCGRRRASRGGGQGRAAPKDDDSYRCGQRFTSISGSLASVPPTVTSVNSAGSGSRPQKRMQRIWYCSGLIRQFHIGTVVVGESVNFAGGLDWLRELGIEVIDLNSHTCIQMLAEYIAANPQVWNEDIGEE